MKKGVLTQLSGSDYIGYEQKQRSKMVRYCKRVGNGKLRPMTWKLCKRNTDVKIREIGTWVTTKSGAN